jgi:L-lactate dehydrogenase complex protein LldG
VTFADPVAQLARSVVAVGGACVRVADLAAADAVVAALPQAAEVADAHTLADLDLAIVPGELAVAENAAVWVEGRMIAPEPRTLQAAHAA